MTQNNRSLTNQEITIINNADASKIEDSFELLASNFTNGQWLDHQNSYSNNLLTTLNRFNSNSPDANRNLAQYIAASSVIHCADGWSYLGRALNAHSRGDCSIASHLGYYAELRAALSILANQGIGIFDHKHFIVDSSGTCSQIQNRNNRGTHEMVWLVIEHWASQQETSSIIGDIVSILGVSLKDWLTSFGGAGSLRIIIKDLLQQWGLDLHRMSDDRSSRNLLSYRPTSITSHISLDPITSSKFLTEIWELCQPSSSSRFELLDCHLLRKSLRYVYNCSMTIRGQTNTNTSTSFNDRVKSSLASLSLATNNEKTPLEKFLTENREHLLLQHASGRLGPTDPSHHIQVISRAVLLLRIATGMGDRLLKSASVTASDLEFWWHSIGEHRALWNSSNEPDNVTDLWEDVSLALSDAEEWTSENSASDLSLAQWCNEQADTISILQGCERIALWGLGL